MRGRGEHEGGAWRAPALTVAQQSASPQPLPHLATFPSPSPADPYLLDSTAQNYSFLASPASTCPPPPTAARTSLMNYALLSLISAKLT